MLSPFRGYLKLGFTDFSGKINFSIIIRIINKKVYVTRILMTPQYLTHESYIIRFFAGQPNIKMEPLSSKIFICYFGSYALRITLPHFWGIGTKGLQIPTRIEECSIQVFKESKDNLTLQDLCKVIVKESRNYKWLHTYKLSPNVDIAKWFNDKKW